jgi:dTDP-4-dehydrorhamnose 3,5-epimerase
MPQIIASPLVMDVQTVNFNVFADERGEFMETFRKEWFPDRSWEIIQSNRSHSAPGVLRGLHYHHRQVDYWQVLGGSIRVALADLRSWSPTYLATQVLELDALTPSALYIPVGVAHGFYAKTAATLLYLVDNYYDSTDELGVAWNDPSLAIAWEVENPLLSARDLKNPILSEIPIDRLPAQADRIAAIRAKTSHK